MHYGPLDVKDLGRVYEALLELEPGVATEPMCRLRRQKLEVVVPVAQGVKYQVSSVRHQEAGEDGLEGVDADVDEEADDAAGEEAPTPDTRHLTLDTSVQWIEAIPPGRFYLRAGLGRKSTGSFYTPDSFVTFLVQETLGPLVEKVSPKHDPRPLAILALKVIDDACGSGHFIVESDRFLGDRLYEACRQCDELALEFERRAEKARDQAERVRLLSEAAAWRQRVADLPDPNDELVLYLPSRSPEGEESGLSQRKALALCKRLVAVHCLYGVDKNPLAVELAKLALWIETQSEGLPLTFLDHRIVVGDSLTGPFFHHLLFVPGSQRSLEGLYSQGLSERFTAALQEALAHIRALEASIGVSEAEMQAKQAAKARLDRALAPFRIVAAAWAGGVMLGPGKCDDESYLWLAGRVADTGNLPEDLAGQEALQAMIARGLGVAAIPPQRDALLVLLASGQCVPALPFDLAFPEVFYPIGDLADRRGFHVALGNPPWDRLLPADKEFFASYDFSIMDAPTKRERDQAQRRLLEDTAVRRRYDAYVSEFRAYERIRDATYQHQVAIIDGNRTIGKQDAFRLFMERNAQLLAPDGVTGVVVPSAFHANEGATGVRKLYLEEMSLQRCYSFENRRKLFEIDSRFKFALVIASRRGPTDEFDCAFYLHDDEWLFGDRSDRTLSYTLRFVKQTGGEYLSLLELRSTAGYQVARVCYQAPALFGETCDQMGVRLGRELNMTDDAWRFTLTKEVLPDGKDPRDPEVAEYLRMNGYLVLQEGKAFHQFTSHWEAAPAYLVSTEELAAKTEALRRTCFFTLSFRGVSSSTNERTSIFSLLPPGTITGHNNPADLGAKNHCTADSLLLLAIANTFPFDFCLRLLGNIYVSMFILDRVPFPTFVDSARVMLVQNGLRLTCNHAGYASLWREQLGDRWREATPPFTWPVLAGDDARWAVRAAIDAVVAQAYGLNREQYEHVLSTFSHKSYPKAPALCLARFDELTEIGLEAFTKKWDPYWDVPLNESLPEAVIELPIMKTDKNTEMQLSLEL